MNNLQQAHIALDYANRIRTQRARTRRAVSDRDRSFTECVIELIHVAFPGGDDVPAHMASANIADVLCWLPSIGAKRAKRILADVDLRPDKRVGDLTPRQRGAVRTALWAIARDRKANR